MVTSSEDSAWSCLAWLLWAWTSTSAWQDAQVEEGLSSGSKGTGPLVAMKGKEGGKEERERGDTPTHQTDR